MENVMAPPRTDVEAWAKDESGVMKIRRSAWHADLTEILATSGNRRFLWGQR